MGHCASAGSQESIVSLLQKGESVKSITMMAEFQELFKPGYTVNAFGDTVLHYASALGNLDIVRWLCSHGADINAKNVHGWTPTDSAHFCNHKNIQDYLEAAGGKLNNFIQIS